MKLKDLSVQYVTDETGQKTGVILPIGQFELLIEDIEDLAVVAERRGEPTVSHVELVRQLKRDGDSLSD